MSPVEALSNTEVLWTPSPERAQASAIAEFARWVGEHRGVELPSDTDYAALHAWSVADLEGFWSAVAEFFGVRWRSEPPAVLGSRAMPGAEWFPGGSLNYADTPWLGRGRRSCRGVSSARTAWSGR
ncbi:acetyl-coenzyme A synthetase N-terminal domain-containing protein [Saccharopolyspora sp. ASAGF58]|uniref:acetyl-coenzyme A synthetase N-terminal domain-containing protein n=1 Tax=Saccharopolyspora sp. ASAGF58 TaxID=2719023 RepID=UPI0014401743|nr:acetyl-coenzyme A synthetase N-terminal domain-containing protein [Saccharopolyspora sp. ASAGF58]QIZ37109.1 hypothetical protein FDZ84_23820 [Saccharopolyspora sp. ASAGF58]